MQLVIRTSKASCFNGHDILAIYAACLMRNSLQLLIFDSAYICWGVLFY